MKYIIQIETDGETGVEVESEPDKIQEVVGRWQALNPIGMYFSMTRRAITVIVDVPNEDAFFEALHATWVLTKSYADVSLVAGAEEFGSMPQCAGVV